MSKTNYTYLNSRVNIITGLLFRCVLDMLGLGLNSLVIRISIACNRNNIVSSQDLVVSVAMNGANYNLGIVLIPITSMGVLVAKRQVLVSVKAHVRHVDGALSTSEDEQVIQETT